MLQGWFRKSVVGFTIILGAFPEGSTEAITANMIAETMLLSQVDEKGGATIWPRYFKGCNDLFTIVEYAVANKIA
jgi:hypothetical protein